MGSNPVGCAKVYCNRRLKRDFNTYLLSDRDGQGNDMVKITKKQLVEMIREAVKEQVAGLPAKGPQVKRPSVGSGQDLKVKGNPWLQMGMSLDQLVAAMKDESDPGQKKLIKKAVMTKLKAAGW